MESLALGIQVHVGHCRAGRYEYAEKEYKKTTAMNMEESYSL